MVAKADRHGGLFPPPLGGLFQPLMRITITRLRSFSMAAQWLGSTTASRVFKALAEGNQKYVAACQQRAVDI